MKFILACSILLPVVTSFAENRDRDKIRAEFRTNLQRFSKTLDRLRSQLFYTEGTAVNNVDRDLAICYTIATVTEQSKSLNFDLLGYADDFPSDGPAAHKLANATNLSNADLKEYCFPGPASQKIYRNLEGLMDLVSQRVKLLNEMQAFMR